MDYEIFLWNRQKPKRKWQMNVRRQLPRRHNLKMFQVKLNEARLVADFQSLLDSCTTSYLGDSCFTNEWSGTHHEEPWRFMSVERSRCHEIPHSCGFSLHPSHDGPQKLRCYRWRTGKYCWSSVRRLGWGDGRDLRSPMGSGILKFETSYAAPWQWIAISIFLVKSTTCSPSFIKMNLKW